MQPQASSLPHAHPLTRLFRPRAVAIVGASAKSSWTQNIVQSTRNYGHGGAMYAVNRSGAAVLGMPGFTSCAEIPEPVDAAFVCVPLDVVPTALDDLARAGIQAAVVLTSGFAETGADGRRRQRELGERAAAHGIRLLGPNSLGFANIAAGAALTSIPLRGALLPEGRVAFVSQSGATAAEIFEFLQQQGTAVSFFAATGNEAQLAIADVVDYLVAEPATRVIAVFAESLRHPERFAAAARRALRAGKPIVVLKVGASEISASVAKAHTGSVVGDDRVFAAACHRLGVIRVETIEDLAVTAGLLAQTGPLAAGGVGVASISGGACTLIADRAERAGLPLPPFAAGTTQALRTILPDYAPALNPLDVTGAAVTRPEIFAECLETLARDTGLALRLCVLNLPYAGELPPGHEPLLSSIGRGLRAKGSPGLLLVQTLKPVSDRSREILRAAGIPGVTGGLDHAVRAAAHVIRWSERYRTRTAADPASPGEPASRRPTDPAATAPLRTGSSSEREALEHLARFGVPVIPAALARTAEEAIAHAQHIGGRVVLKISSADITHKSDVGGVVLGLNGDAAVGRAFDAIQHAVRRAAPTARIEGVLVSPMREQGIELFVGTAVDPDWGAVIAVGLGGIWIEALRDTALRLLPVGPDEVLEMLESLRGARLLQGLRGTSPADLPRLADVIAGIGTAALALGEQAAALEVNPLLVDGSHIEALDALVVWR